MKLDKKYMKFYEVGNNKYYLLKYDEEDELYIATESFIPMEKKFLFFRKRKDFTQGLKLLQLTSPILSLFKEIIDSDVDKMDEDFEDMITYKKVDNVELRKNIENLYKTALDSIVQNIKDEFGSWKDNLILDNKKLSDEELDKIIKINEERFNNHIQMIKSSNIINDLSFKWKNGENLVIKKMLETKDMEFLYSHKIGTGYKIYYLYDLDVFGTVTIYKIHCVKDIIKSVESFVYNRKLIQELIEFMVNNEL